MLQRSLLQRSLIQAVTVLLSAPNTAMVLTAAVDRVYVLVLLAESAARVNAAPPVRYYPTERKSPTSPDSAFDDERCMHCRY